MPDHETYRILDVTEALTVGKAGDPPGKLTVLGHLGVRDSINLGNQTLDEHVNELIKNAIADAIKSIQQMRFDTLVVKGPESALASINWTIAGPDGNKSILLGQMGKQVMGAWLSPEFGALHAVQVRAGRHYGSEKVYETMIAVHFVNEPGLRSFVNPPLLGMPQPELRINYVYI